MPRAPLEAWKAEFSSRPLRTVFGTILSLFLLTVVVVFWTMWLNAKADANREREARSTYARLADTLSSVRVWPVIKLTSDGSATAQLRTKCEGFGQYTRGRLKYDLTLRGIERLDPNLASTPTSVVETPSAPAAGNASEAYYKDLQRLKEERDRFYRNLELASVTFTVKFFDAQNFLAADWTLTLSDFVRTDSAGKRRLIANGEGPACGAEILGFQSWNVASPVLK